MLYLETEKNTIEIHKLSSNAPWAWVQGEKPDFLGWENWVAGTSNILPYIPPTLIAKISEKEGYGVLEIAYNSYEEIIIGSFGNINFSFTPVEYRVSGTTFYLDKVKVTYGEYSHVIDISGGKSFFGMYLRAPVEQGVIYMPYHIVAMKYVNGVENNQYTGTSKIMYYIAGGDLYGKYFTKEQAYNWNYDFAQSLDKYIFYRDTISFTFDLYVGNQEDIFSSDFRGFKLVPFIIQINDELYPEYNIPPNDPFYPGGSSGIGGGTGDFDGTNTPVDFPNLPSLSAVDTGFINIYNPTLAQLKELSNFLWSDLFDIDTLIKLFADPMDIILGLSILPVSIPSSNVKEITIGNIGTGISMNLADTQYIEVDCGSLNINEFWGAYLDYEPYTKTEIYLPFIGIHAISTDEIMGRNIHIKYHVDILSGACVAFIKCGDSVLYQFNGQCSAEIPITSQSYSNIIGGVLSVATSIGSMVASGGTSAPLEIGHIANTAVNSLKPSIEKSGSLSGAGGLMNLSTPYLILTRPIQALPKYQNTYIGYPAFITVTLSELTGYTEVESVHLENMSATDIEKQEIENLLKNGVIF